MKTGGKDKDTKHTLAELLDWRDDEQIYRDYYLAKADGADRKKLREILRRPQVSEDDRRWLDDPSSIDPYKTETDFFNAGRNVQIKRHPRYFPLFFHSHAFFEIIYVLAGRCREYTGERPEVAETVTLKAGDIFLLAPGVTHGIEVYSDDCVVLNILVRRSTFMDIFMNTVRDKSQISLFFLGNLYEREKQPYLLFHTGQDASVREAILEMYREQREMDEYADRIVCALLTVFFNRLNRSYVDSARPGGMVDTHNAAQRGEILSYIIANYRTVTLSGLARDFHFSVPYCSRLVREMTGIPFQSLVTRVRLQAAENLLLHTQMGVADIGEQVGYQNPETFIRAFQRVYGLSPSQYRKQGRTGEGERAGMHAQ